MAAAINGHQRSAAQYNGVIAASLGVISEKSANGLKWRRSMAYHQILNRQWRKMRHE
jgi:hypothetical protein